MEKMGPIPAGHSCIGMRCAICRAGFREGESLTLFGIGPDDEDDARRAAEGRPYTEAAVLVHWGCVPEMAKEDAS